MFKICLTVLVTFIVNLGFVQAEEVKDSVANPIIFDYNGLTLRLGDRMDSVDVSRWNLSTKDHLATYSPVNKESVFNAVTVLKDQSNSKLLGVRTDVRVPLAKDEKIQETGFFGGIMNSIIRPTDKVVTIYRLKDSIVRKDGNRFEVVNTEACRNFIKDFEQLKECNKKIAGLSAAAVAFNSKDQQILKDLSDSEEIPSGVLADIPNKLFTTAVMCDELAKYTNNFQTGDIADSVRPTNSPEIKALAK